MKEVDVSTITKSVRNLCIDANYYLSEDVKKKIKECEDNENWPTAKGILKKILENIDISKNEHMPMCQDT